MRAQIFLKFGPGSGSGYKVPEKFAILNIKVQFWHMYWFQRLHYFSLCNWSIGNNKLINKLFYDCLEPLISPTIPNWAKQPTFVAVRVISVIFWNFCVFFRLNILKNISNKILNSWRKDKLSTSMKLNQQYDILHFGHFF